jgi:SLT domain-containing protein
VITGVVIRAVEGLTAAIRTLLSMINAVINAVETLISALSRIRVPKISLPSLPKRGGGIPFVPKLAAGGIVTRPTLAMVGEAGPEAVIPLGRGGGSSRPMVVNVQLDGRTLASLLIDPLRNEAKVFESRSGRPAFS